MSDTGDLAPHSGISWNNSDRTVGVVEYGGGDKGQTAIFFLDKRHNPAKSEQMGHPIYDNVPFVRIGPPGERLNIVIRPATDIDKRRFALHWAQFTQNVEQRPSGTPISILYPEHPAVNAMFEGCSVFTVEQLAELSANAIENIGMGCQKYVNEAQQYLKMAEKGVKHTEFRKQLEDRDREIAGLKQSMSELQNTVTKLLKDRGSRAVNQFETAEAGAMERPTHMPHTAFDAQTAQIEASGRAMRPAPAKPKRARPRI